MKRKWVAAYVAGGSEIRFAAWLNERGIRAFVPLGKRSTKPQRKRKAVIKEVPAFSCYVFVYIKMSRRRNREWGVLLTAPGFLRVITNDGGRVTTIPDIVVRELIWMQDRGDFNHKSLSLAFVPGQRVDVTDGPHKFARGEVIEGAESLEEWPLIQLSGSKVKIHVSMLEISR